MTEYTPEFLDLFQKQQQQGKTELVCLQGGANRQAPTAQELARKRRLSLRVTEAKRQLEAAEKFANMARIRYLEALAAYDPTILEDGAKAQGTSRWNG